MYLYKIDKLDVLTDVQGPSVSYSFELNRVPFFGRIMAIIFIHLPDDAIHHSHVARQQILTVEALCSEGRLCSPASVHQRPGLQVQVHTQSCKLLYFRKLF
jgi:hypothetical protein